MERPGLLEHERLMMRIPILYQDDALVVIDKPVGIPTHAAEPSDPYPADAVRLVQAQLGLPYLGMHQRLDAETSGVLLFSARHAANPALAAAFEGRAVQKAYLALVLGAAPAQGTIDAPIARLRGSEYGVVSRTDPQGQAARTHYRLLQQAPGGRFSLLEVTTETGRTHQIRVHLAHAGNPVAGDALYGPPQPAPRLGLHAHRLTLPRPGTGQPLTFVAPPPDLFALTGEAERALAAVAEGTPARALAAEAPLLRQLLAWARSRREPLAGSPGTTIYRLVNGAADGLPGLTVDRYGEVLVASFYEAQTGPPQPLPAVLAEALLETLGGASLYVKFRPREAGRLREEELAALAPAAPARGPALAEVTAHEEGLAVVIRPGAGLSVGLFPDMREMRARVKAWAGGRRVLNCFAYTCGFGLAAAVGGAARVLNLDLSRPVLEWGQANYRANGLHPDPYDFVYGDVFDWLARLGRRGEQFDLVILDPPGFARGKQGAFSQARDYGALAALAARVTGPAGLLLACSNVAELPWRRFREQVLEGVRSAGRQAEVAGVFHEPAVDFPTFGRQEPYLKLLLLRLP